MKETSRRAEERTRLFFSLAALPDSTPRETRVGGGVGSGESRGKGVNNERRHNCERQFAEARRERCDTFRHRALSPLENARPRAISR
jgi:hypothetical protein